MRRKKREEAELKRKKQEIENLAKEEKRKIEEERKQLEEMRKALMQQQKQLDIEKTKLKREEEKVRRKSRMSDVHVLDTNKRASVLPPPQLSSLQVSALKKTKLTPRTPSPSNNRLRGKKEAEPSPKIEKSRKSLTPRSSIPSPKTSSKHIHNEVSSSIEALEEDPSCQKSEDGESRSKKSKASKKDVSELPSSDTDLKKPQDNIENKSLTVTQVKTKRKSREEMRDEMMKANVERRRENTEEMLRRMEAVKEKARIRREELEIGKREKSKKLEQSKSTDENKLLSTEEPLNHTVSKTAEEEISNDTETSTDSDDDIEVPYNCSLSKEEYRRELKRAKNWRKFNFKDECIDVAYTKPEAPISKEELTEVSTNFKPISGATDGVDGIKVTSTTENSRSKKEIADLEDSQVTEKIVKTVSKTTIGRRRGRPSKNSLANDGAELVADAALESPKKKLKLDKKLSLSSSKKKAEPIVKVPRTALLSTIDDVDSEESPFFAPVPKLSKRKAKNPEPQIDAEPRIEKETNKGKSRKKDALNITAETSESVAMVKSPPKRGRSKKKVVEEIPSSLETSLVEKKPVPKRPAAKRQTKSKKKTAEEAASVETAGEETRRLSVRLENIEIQEREEVTVDQSEEKPAVKKGRGRKPKASVPDSIQNEAKKTELMEEPHIESEKELEASSNVVRGRPKRVAKKKFDTLAGFADR